ncbi:TonB-dependent receptor domain-containing protein [Parasphingopyxis marina]|uniref:TonB-dependent receptor n=1 Tax=Parasphingopyxis marina TaxID=2761622 RepID=A0A842HWA9_9SPHN|nr:TonB-dependent receptor [Parasphingopyxis marina]MBC2777185.1 TonB-dependent receptor [Parasphingopyxis marina]
MPVAAQTSANTEETENISSVSAEETPSEAIVVTGTRIVRDGYESPTPVTIATSEDLTRAAPSGLPDGLNRLPQFVGSSGPNASSNTFATPDHGNVLNLRGLGPIRTLNLINGVRLSPTTYVGTVNADLIPQALVERVEVVTAGASASYGSDAVAGVVNFVLDTDFNGFRGFAQAGISTRGDNETLRGGAAGGFDLGDRLHVLLSYEHIESDGYTQGQRPALDLRGLAVGSVIGGGQSGTAANPLIFQTNAGFSFSSFNGHAANGPFAGTLFLPGGQYRPLDPGAPTGSAGYFVGGDYYYGPSSQSASAALRTDTIFGRVDYDVADTVAAYVQFMGSESVIRYGSLPNLLTFTPVIFSGNAFLPADLQAQLTAGNVESFGLRKAFLEFGPIPARERIRNYQVFAGLEGEIGNLNWNVDYTHGNSVFNFSQPNQYQYTRFAAAIDAVRDPATGNIVCRPTLDPDPDVRARYAGCVPFNPFGFGAASPEARDYVMGVSTYRAETSTDDITVGLSGDLIDLPAGPISFAVGVEYREQSLDLTSNSNPAIAEDITGLRGLPPTTPRYYLTNTGVASGSNSVREVYGELAVPILADQPFARQLDLNGAIRYTDYSTSGGVTTWKLGGTWAPIDDIRFRVVRSRDIRAPTLFDLFAGAQVTQAAALDPHTNVTFGASQRASGNPDLEPEISDSWSVGVVLQPSFLPGFAMSIDAYEIDLRGAISTLSAIQVLLDCESSGGTAPSCDTISRPLPFSDTSPANVPTEIRVTPINISTIETRGIDIDASYRTGFADGQLAVRLYATYVDRFRRQLSGSQPVIEYAGYSTLGARGDTTVPRWKGALSVSYDSDDFSIFVQENMIGEIKLGPTLTYAEPNMPAWFTTDLTVTARPGFFNGDAELFFTVNNLFDDTPPIFFGNLVPGLGLGTLNNLYDTTGRQFTAGFRVNF